MIPEFDRGVAVINEVLGINGAGFPQEDTLPGEIDLSALWRVIAPSEVDPHRCPFDREIFWGLDLVHGGLVITEIMVGETADVTPQFHHLIGVHTHPRMPSLNPFVVDEAEIAPGEMAYLLDNPDQYAELVLVRSTKRELYPSTLVLKTAETRGVRYGDHEPLKQEYHLQSILFNYPFWRRERAFHGQCDKLAQEKHIALYRGTIVPGSLVQSFFKLVP